MNTRLHERGQAESRVVFSIKILLIVRAHQDLLSNDLLVRIVLLRHYPGKDKHYLVSQN